MIYLDNNATTKVNQEVLEEMLPYLKEEYGNPGSRYYTLAKNAEKALNIARERVANLINADENEIIFTSSGSESNNFIIKGMADYLKNYKGKGSHLLTSKFEHSSVINTMRYLNGEIYMNKEIKSDYGIVSKIIDRGFDLDFVESDSFGNIIIEDLDKKIREDTILASFIWANNETGNINDIDKISNYFKSKDIFFHTDATQIVGKLPIDLKELEIDGLTFSGHKLYGPKGVGVAYLKKEPYTQRQISSLIHGGENQEFGYRAGTPALHDIVGLGKACELVKKDLEINIEYIKNLEEHLIHILKNNFENIIFVSNLEDSVPGVVSFIIPDINNQILLRNLSKKVAFSSGSACTLGTDSRLLENLGLDKYKSNFFRISMSKYNSLEEIVKLQEYLS